ncbi:hypothetical protein HDU85_003326 [Gaertneriomyces sp. JEL0708]|nr:hypothetical protein HDU85_003326 [Gaertneriomyces sp. JEL0708]
MGNKSSKASRSKANPDAHTTSPAAAAPSTSHAPPPSFAQWSPAKILALDADSLIKQQLVKWVKSEPKAKEKRLHVLLEAHDECIKRAVVYRAAIRCDDDVETATSRLVAAGETIVQKYLAGDKNLGTLLGPSFECGDDGDGNHHHPSAFVAALDLTKVGAFDPFIQALADRFQRDALEIVATSP